MDHAKQHPEAARQMKVAAKDNQSCIDCHKGIAHQLPDMSSGFRKQFDELRASANDSGDTLYSIDIKPIYAAKGDKEASGSLLPASEVNEATAHDIIIIPDNSLIEISEVSPDYAPRKAARSTRKPRRC